MPVVPGARAGSNLAPRSRPRSRSAGRARGSRLDRRCDGRPVTVGPAQQSGAAGPTSLAQPWSSTRQSARPPERRPTDDGCARAAVWRSGADLARAALAQHPGSRLDPRSDGRQVTAGHFTVTPSLRPRCRVRVHTQGARSSCLRCAPRVNRGVRPRRRPARLGHSRPEQPTRVRLPTPRRGANAPTSHCRRSGRAKRGRPSSRPSGCSERRTSPRSFTWQPRRPSSLPRHPARA